MKRLSLVLVLVLAAVSTGCAMITKPLFRPILGTNAVPARTESRVSFATNFAAVAVTNAAGAVSYALGTNIVQTVTPVFVPATFSIVTNGWEVRPSVETGLEIAGGATNLFAPGFGTIGTAAASGILSLWCAWLNRKTRTANETAAGLVRGIESFRQAAMLTPVGAKISDHLVEQIKAHVPAATQAGLLLEQLIEKHTGDTSASVKVAADFAKAIQSPAA